MSPSPSDNGRRAATASSSPTVLVTGAAGFIGSHLCDRLLSDGYRVWALDNFDDFYSPARKRENLRAALDQPAMHLVEGDIRDRVLLDGLMSDVSFDAVVHLAARPGGDASRENPELSYDVNVRGTLTVLEAMRRHGVPALLFASSASVYGDGSEPPFREESAADRPLSPYAASKRSGELLCHTYHHLHALTVHCLRLFSVFGPRQRPDLAVHGFTRQLTDGSPVTVSGDDSGRRDFVYVGDIVDGLVLSLERARAHDGERAEYRVINLGRGESVRILDLLDGLGAATGLTPEVDHVPKTSDDAFRTLADLERAEELLDYRPSVSLEDGLAEFVRWYREKDGVGGEPQSGAAPAVKKDIGG